MKGKFASYKFVGSGDRLTEPLIKRNGIFEPASWEEALTLVSSKFNEIKAENGADALAGFRALEQQMKIIMSFKNGASLLLVPIMLITVPVFVIRLRSMV